MRNKWYITDWSVTFFILTVGAVLFSWIGNIYGLEGVQSLLSAEGIRWALNHVIKDYVETPALGIFMVFFMGLGIGVRAGLYEALNRYCRKESHLSRKERRALLFALMIMGGYLTLVLITLMLPWNFLQSITGSWINSPLAKGGIYILSIGFGLSGMAYGYVSDVFRNVSDVVESMSCLISKFACYLVALFFVVQFFSVCRYARLDVWIGLSDVVVSFLFYACCFLPVCMLVYTSFWKSNHSKD